MRKLKPNQWFLQDNVINEKAGQVRGSLSQNPGAGSVLVREAVCQLPGPARGDEGLLLCVGVASSPLSVPGAVRLCTDSSKEINDQC